MEDVSTQCLVILVIVITQLFTCSSLRAITLRWALPSLSTYFTNTESKVIQPVDVFCLDPLSHPASLPPYLLAKTRTIVVSCLSANCFDSQSSWYQRSWHFYLAALPCLACQILCSHSGTDVFVLAFYFGQINEEKINRWSWFYLAGW